MDFSDPQRLQGLAEALTRLFYCLLAVALLAALFGSAGSGFLLLVLAGAAHVARVGVEGMLGVGIEKPKAKPRTQRRPRPAAARTAAPTRPPRRATAPSTRG